LSGLHWPTRSASLVLSALVLALVLGSAPEPHVPRASPRPSVTAAQEPPSRQGRDPVAFRTLTVEDFRAERLDPRLAPHARGLGVAACLFIVTDPDLTVSVGSVSVGSVSVESERENERYAAVAENLAFHARLDRNCSWWSRTSRLSRSFRLQHAQIHFAIFEIAARRHTLRLLAALETEEISAATREAAREAFQRRIDAELEDALRNALDRGMEFDEDTAGMTRQDQRQPWARQSRLIRWQERVAEELEETSARLGRS